jgi:hypothetical protein
LLRWSPQPAQQRPAAELFGIATEVNRDADLIDLLPGDAKGIGTPALRAREAARQPPKTCRQPARVEALANQQGRDPGRTAAQLDVVDTTAAAPFGVEEVKAGSVVRVAPGTTRSHRNEGEEAVEIWAVSRKIAEADATKVDDFWAASPSAARTDESAA